MSLTEKVGVNVDVVVELLVVEVDSLLAAAPVVVVEETDEEYSDGGP